MKKIHLTLLIILVGFKVLSQPKVSDSLIYSFMNKAIFTTDSLLINLEENSENKFIYMDTSSFLNDSSLFTNEDFSFFRAQLQELDNFKWKPTRLNGMKVISNDSLTKIFKNYDGWEYFNAFHGDCLSSFSLPIFSHEYSYCIIQTGSQCGERRGKGKIVVYKNVDKEWVVVKTYTVWKS
jgi:hypothetical protein